MSLLSFSKRRECCCRFDRTSWEEKPSYSVKASDARLKACGFHPNVCSLTVDQYIRKWIDMAKRFKHKPTPEQYLQSLITGQDLGLDQKHTGPLLRATVMDSLDATFTCSRCQLYFLCDHQVFGPVISENLWSNGIKTVEQASQISKEFPSAIASNTNIYCFETESFYSHGNNGTFIVVRPSFSITEIVLAHDDETSQLKTFAKRVMNEEESVMSAIENAVKAITSKTEPNLPAGVFETLSPAALKAVKLNVKVGGKFGPGQFTNAAAYDMYQPLYVDQGKMLASMLQEMLDRKKVINVLVLEKVPLVDRRILAIILEGLTSVTMVGIYDCQLLHFADVDYILDLISQVNKTRTANGLPTIVALDFFPHYENGTPFDILGGASYGVSWEPILRDVQQRGFYHIIMKAFLKAQGMKLELLFDKDKAFMDFLRKVPNPPLGVPMFLDGLWRYLETPKEKSLERRKQFFDILRPVYQGIKGKMKDSVWNETRMEANTDECESCHYRSHNVFFPDNGTFCGACFLTRSLDTQLHRLRRHKLSAISHLFENWKKGEHNPQNDAPIPETTTALLSCRTNVKRCKNRIIDTSTEGLPTLEYLVSSDCLGKWMDFDREMRSLDVFCRAIREAHIVNPLAVVKSRLYPFGPADTDCEIQRPRADNGSSHRANYVSYSWGDALREYEESDLPPQKRTGFW